MIFNGFKACDPYQDVVTDRLSAPHESRVNTDLTMNSTDTEL